MTTLINNTTFTEGTDTDQIGSASPTTGNSGFIKDSGQTGFFVYSVYPYTLWLKDSNGWSSYQTFSANNLLSSSTFAWGDFTAAYIQTAAAGHVIYIYPRTEAILIDGDPNSSPNELDTLVIPGTPSANSVTVAPIAQFPQWGDVNGHIHPSSNEDYDIGSAEYKVRHLFLSDNSLYIGDTWIKAEGDSVKTPNLLVGDLNLNNTGRQNEVDGTSGHWTIQEGSSDLFLINRATGKKYRFNITEVEEN